MKLSALNTGKYYYNLNQHTYTVVLYLKNIIKAAKLLHASGLILLLYDGVVGVSGFYSLTVNLIQVFDLNGLNYRILIVMYGMETVKYVNMSFTICKVIFCVCVCVCVYVWQIRYT